MRPFGQFDLRVESLLAEFVDLGEKRSRIDDDAVSEHPDFAPDRAARYEGKLVLVVAVDDGMAGVVPALIPDDDVGGLTQ